MRHAALVLMVAAILGSGWPAAARAAEPARPPIPQGLISTQIIPFQSREARGAVWDSLERFERYKRWAASESLATILIRTMEAEPRPDSMALSRALFYFAHSKLVRRIHAGGLGVESMERGLAIRERHPIPNDTLVIWAHVRAANFFGEAGHLQRAIEHGERGLRMLQSMSPTDTSVLAEAHRSLAVALAAVGRDTEALPHFESALAMRMRADGGESRQAYTILSEYSGCLVRNGDLEGARAMLQRAIGLAEGSGIRGNDYATCLGRLSSFENRVGNLSESIELAWKAFEINRQLDHSSIATLRARTTLAYRLQEFGDMQGSASHLREILPPFAAGLGAGHPQVVNARLALVRTLVNLGDTAEAARELAAARPALALQDLQHNNNQVYSMMLGADLDALRGRYVAARETLSAAIAIEWGKHDSFGALQADLLANLYDKLRGPADAGYVLAAARETQRLIDSTHVRAAPEWHALLLARASAESRAGLGALAWEHALEAERLTRERLSFQLEALPDLRGLQLAQQLGSPCELLTALAIPGDAAQQATAWDRIVRWRGLVRHEIGRRRIPVEASTDTAVAAAHARWVDAQRRLAQRVVGGAAHPDDPESAARYERSKQQAEDAERAFVRAARGRVPLDSIATLERVLARLQTDQALVAFATASDGAGEPSLGAFVADGRARRPRWISLGPVSEIERDVRAWIERVARPPTGDVAAEEAACRVLGVRVRERIWDPIHRVTAQAAERIVIPEGVVADVPWLALPAEKGRYLAESPTALRLIGAERDLLSDPPAASAGRGLLAAGGPDFSGRGGLPLAVSATESSTWRSQLSPCASPGSLALPELPAARIEAERIARSWPESSGAARLLVGPEATEAAWKQTAPGKAVLHLATHGVMIDGPCGSVASADAAAAGTRGVGGVVSLDASPPRRLARPVASTPKPRALPTNPWLARQVWLALAGANAAPSGLDENEGLLTAEEVVTLDLRGTDWVVLSACHSGVGERWTREGVLGMRRAFQLAGARAVIASRWSVGDESTSEWMSALYAGRARGATASAAVKEACRTVLAARRAGHRPTHPFYWAAFSAWEG